MENIAKHCYEQILAQTKRPLFVAVTGDSGSGKSFLASLLVAEFKRTNVDVTLINLDDFLISRQDREPMKSIYYQNGRFAGKSHWEILENMFRLDDCERVMRDLKNGMTTMYYPYSRLTGEISNVPTEVSPSDFIIFDTSMMLEEMDFVILINVTQENIIARKLNRDSDIRTPESIREMHEKVQGHYWQDRGKPASADIVIDNNHFENVRLVETE